MFARCIACGQTLGQSVAEPDEDQVPARDDGDVPLSKSGEITGGVPPISVLAAAAAADAAAPPPGTSGVQAPPVSADLDEAAYRMTVIEHVPPPTDEVSPRSAAQAEAVPPATPRGAPPRSPAPAPAPAGTADATPKTATGRKFLVRLLLPEGDRRTVEVGPKPIKLGSGLDELGLPGDPRVGSSEARIVADDGRLWVEPVPDAQGVYRRIQGEVTLREGDVILAGDIAARFERVDQGPPVDGARQVLGGSAGAACGRIVFLRRDGSPGPVHDLPAGKTIIGRTDGHLNFPQDSRLSRRHARFFATDTAVTLEDMDSRNGTYLRVRERTELAIGDALRVGSAGLQIRALA